MKDTLRNIAILYHNGGVKLETCISAIKDDEAFKSLIQLQADLTNAYIDAINASPGSKVKRGCGMQTVGELVEQRIQLKEIYKHNQDKSIKDSINRLEHQINKHRRMVAAYGEDMKAVDDIESKLKSINVVTRDPDGAAIILLSAALVLQYADEEAAKVYNQSMFGIDDFYGMDIMFKNFGIPNHKEIDRIALDVRLEVMHRSDTPEIQRPEQIQSYKVESDSAYRCLLNMAPWYGSVDYSGKDLISIITDNGSIVGMKL